LEEYIQEKQVLDASGLTYDINNKYLSDNLKNMLVGIAEEGESATLERTIAQMGKGLDQKIDETGMLQTSEAHKNGQGWTAPDATALKNLVQGITIDRKSSGEFDINIKRLGSGYDFMSTEVNTSSSVIDYKQLCLLLFAYIKSTIPSES
jgi:adenylyl- and sulfurtransferase ThiI